MHSLHLHLFHRSSITSLPHSWVLLHLFLGQLLSGLTTCMLLTWSMAFGRWMSFVYWIGRTMRTDSGKSSTKVLHRQAHIMIKSDDGLFHLRCFVRLPYTLNVLVLVTGLDLRSLFLSKNRRCMFLVPAALLLVFLSPSQVFLLPISSWFVVCVYSVYSILFVLYKV